ncbi:MAG: autotransporter domain-containing protein [Hyphomicrobiales bacterium]
MHRWLRTCKFRCEAAQPMAHVDMIERAERVSGGAEFLAGRHGVRATPVPLVLLASVAAQALLLASGAHAADTVIPNGATVTIGQVLTQEGDSLTVETGGAISVGDEIAVDAQVDGVTLAIAGTVQAGAATAVHLSDESILSLTGVIRSLGTGIEAGSGNVLDIAGTVSAATSAILIGGDQNQVTVESTGTLSATGNALQIGGDSNVITNSGDIAGDAVGVSLSHGDDNSLYNAGSISGGTRGALINGDGTLISNSGTITGGKSGLRILGSNSMVDNSGDITATGGNSYGLEFYGNGNLLVNSGAISGSETAVFASGTGNTVINAGYLAAGFNGVQFYQGGNALINSGTIIAASADGDGVYLKSSNSVTNTGDISGGFIGIAAADDNLIVNAGQVTGGTVALYAHASNVISNSGDISGGSWGIYAGSANTIRNSGSISGTLFGIEMESGNSLSNSGSIAGGEVGVFGQASNSVVNAGAISGDGWGLWLEGGGSLVINSGSISGGTAGLLVDAMTASTGNAIDNSGALSGGQYAVQLLGSGTTLNILAGSNIQGVLALGTGNVVTIGRGLNTAFTHTGDPTVTAASGMLVDSGTVIAAVDVTGLAAEDDRLADVTRALADAIDARLAAARRGGAGIATAADGSIRPVADAPPEPKVSAWATAIGGWSRHDADGHAAEYDSRLAGMVVGADRRLSDVLRLGAFAGYAVSGFDTETSSQSIDAKDYVAGFYAGLDQATWFANLSVSGGLSRQSSDRTVLNNTVAGGIEYAEASHDGLFLSPSVTLGTRLSLPHGTLTPSLRARYAIMALDGYEEEGSTADLTVDDRSVGLAELRGQLAYAAGPWNLSGGTMGLAVRGGADLTFSSASDIEAELLATSLSFDSGGEATAVRAVLGLDLSFLSNGGTSFNLTSELARGSSSSVDATMQIGIGMSL